VNSGINRTTCVVLLASYKVWIRNGILKKNYWQAHSILYSSMDYINLCGTIDLCGGPIPGYSLKYSGRWRMLVQRATHELNRSHVARVECPETLPTLRVAKLRVIQRTLTECNTDRMELAIAKFEHASANPTQTCSS
jgi:hypothetical protein